MSKSRSFDRAANYYDQTRRMLEPMEKFGIPAIQELAGQGSRLLEVGCGTGRISIPLLERGVDLVGCDLSTPMLNRFREKYPAPRIAQANAAQLPFPSGHFDAVLTVHVLHLIPAWREVLREIKRVLLPGGVYLNARTWDTVGVSVADKTRKFWRNWMKDHGVDAGHPGVQKDDEMHRELRELGAEITEVVPARFTDSINLREELDRFASRIYSETWEIPDDIFDASIKELRRFAEQEYGDLDQEIAGEVRFVIHVARFGT